MAAEIIRCVLCFSRETVHWNAPALWLIAGRLDSSRYYSVWLGSESVLLVAGEQLRMQAKILTTQGQRLWLQVTAPEPLCGAAWASVCDV